VKKISSKEATMDMEVKTETDLREIVCKYGLDSIGSVQISVKTFCKFNTAPSGYSRVGKLHGLSPRANYTDRATAACWRSDCQRFADRGCHVDSVMDPYGRSLDFLDSSRYFFYQVAPQLYSRG
jgi:hypothetical protein